MGEDIKNILSASENTAAAPPSGAGQSPSDDDERKKRLRKSMIKFGSLAVFALIVFIFATISWFAANTTVSGDGMGVGVGSAGFELRVSSGNIGYSSLYSFIDPSLSGHTGLSTTSSNDTIRWRISGTDDKLRPGSQGALEFEVVSTGANVSTLKYSLEIECYKATTEKVDDTEVVTALDKIVPPAAQEPGAPAFSADELNGANYFRSHIMFFTSRTGNSEENYRYSGYIEDISDFTLTPDQDDKAVIYWIWPNTLGQIVLDSDLPADRDYLASGAVSLLNDDGELNDRQAITDFLQTDQYVFKGDYDFDELIDTLYSVRAANVSAAEPQSYQFEYEKLSGGYNAADLVIGKNVNYVSVLLNASTG